MPFQRITVQDSDGTSLQGEIIPISSARDTQASFVLADGTTLTIQPVVVQVTRIDGHYDKEGNPKYIVKTQLVVNAISPENLRRQDDPK